MIHTQHFSLRDLLPFKNWKRAPHQEWIAELHSFFFTAECRRNFIPFMYLFTDRLFAEYFSNRWGGNKNPTQQQNYWQIHQTITTQNDKRTHEHTETHKRINGNVKWVGGVLFCLYWPEEKWGIFFVYSKIRRIEKREREKEREMVCVICSEMEMLMNMNEGEFVLFVCGFCREFDCVFVNRIDVYMGVQHGYKALEHILTHTPT